MSIVFATDFSEVASRAATVAGALAVKMKQTLHLVHAQDPGLEGVLGDSTAEVRRKVLELLELQASELRALGASVGVHVESGSPDEVVLSLARRVAAKLIVITALGRRQPGKWKLGSHAERLAQQTHIPVLVVRDPEPFLAWVRDARPLRILFGADFSSSGQMAARWVHELQSFGPCELVAVHLYLPPEQFHRLGLGGLRSFVDEDPEVTKALERDFATHYGRLIDTKAVKFRTESHIGRIGDRLAAIATEEGCALIVVGSHVRGAAMRLWAGSVSRDVLHCAATSVVCVSAPLPEQAGIAPFNQVLVATDFSEIGNAAVVLAYSAATAGGTVHIVHVVGRGTYNSISPHDIFEAPKSAADQAKREKFREQLLALVPKDAQALSRNTEVHVLESNAPAGAICQAAERLGADVICLGTRGATGLTGKVLGSISQAVVADTRRPVLLAHGPKA